VFIEVDSNPPRGKCLETVPSLIHEVMHALYVPQDSELDEEHSASGIFQPKAGAVDFIDDISLSKLCQGFECLTFNPESN
jgi:hypothetical protein